jgi:hypothetical protein
MGAGGIGLPELFWMYVRLQYVQPLQEEGHHRLTSLWREKNGTSWKRSSRFALKMGKSFFGFVSTYSSVEFRIPICKYTGFAFVIYALRFNPPHRSHPIF